MPMPIPMPIPQVSPGAIHIQPLRGWGGFFPAQGFFPTPGFFRPQGFFRLNAIKLRKYVIIINM